jgi:two-component system response regulator AtoC
MGAQNSQLSILVIDDDPDVLRTLGGFLERREHKVQMVERATEGLKALKSGKPDVVITDLKMPEMDGFEVLERVREISPSTEVIMITAFGDIAGAVRAIREGAFDFFTKPLDVQALDAALQRTLRFHALRKEKDRYRERLDRMGTEARQQYGLPAIIGESPEIEVIRNLIEQVCKTDTTTVLIQGETGTGKELVARAIHHESDRADGPFVAVDCSAIPQALVESEFYGHVRGAFTDARQERKGHFEQADGGTLFLDEIGDMDPAMQAKFLRTLEERRIRPVGGTAEVSVDIRVVSASNQNLLNSVTEGSFREDLYYRLNAFTIQLPSLRERSADILPLASHFLTRYAQELRKRITGFDPVVQAMLQAHAFPGNIRELRNLIERAVILCRSDEVSQGDLQFDYLETPEDPVKAESYPMGLMNTSPKDLTLASVESTYISEALSRTGGNKARAARLLGISRDALRRRMEKHGLQ